MLTPEELEAWAIELVSGYQEELVSKLKEHVITTFAHGGELSAADWDAIRKLSMDNRIAMQSLLARYQPKIDKQMATAVQDILTEFDRTEYVNAAPYYADLSPVGSSPRFESISRQVASGVVGVVQRNNLEMVQQANEAWLRVSAEAITRVEQGYPMYQILDRGVGELMRLSGRIKYVSGQNYPIDAAIKRHASSQIAQASDAITQARLAETGHTIVYTSSHWASREEHEPFQGRAYSTKIGGENWEGLYYPDLRTTGWPNPITGMCTGINCGHRLGAYYGGEIPQAPKTMGGVTSSEAYELKQKQRALEVKVRNAKQKVWSHEQVGIDTSSARLELGKAQRDLRSFVATNEDKGIYRAYYRERAYAIGAQPRALRKERLLFPDANGNSYSMPKSWYQEHILNHDDTDSVRKKITSQMIAETIANPDIIALNPTDHPNNPLGKNFYRLYNDKLAGKYLRVVTRDSDMTVRTAMPVRKLPKKSIAYRKDVSNGT